MKKIFMVRRITMIMFLLVLFGFSYLNLRYSLPYIKEIITENNEDQGKLEEKTLSEEVESVIEDKVLMKEFFVESYGYIQRLMNKSEFSNFDIVKDKNDNLYYSYFDKEENDVSELLKRTVNLKETLDDEKVEYLHVVPTSKHNETSKFEIGVPMPLDNEVVDNYLDGLNKSEINYLDLRKDMSANGLSNEEQFYKTDHHWTIQAAFWAFTEIVDNLNELYDAELDSKEYYTNIKNYNQITYEKSFLGSLGRKTGLMYSGVDDFTLIKPKFNMDFTYTITDVNGETKKITGKFEETLINQDPFEKQYEIKEENADKYFTYLDGNWPYVSIKNNKIKENNKILIIKDSFAIPVGAFLSTVFKQVDLVDPRFNTEPIEDIIKRNNYDYVITLFSVPNYTEEFFDFGNLK